MTPAAKQVCPYRSCVFIQATILQVRLGRYQKISISKYRYFGSYRPALVPDYPSADFKNGVSAYVTIHSSSRTTALTTALVQRTEKTDNWWSKAGMIPKFSILIS